MDNPEYMTSLGTQNTRRRQTKQKHNTICVRPLYTNKHNNVNKT